LKAPINRALDPWRQTSQFTATSSRSATTASITSYTIVETALRFSIRLTNKAKGALATTRTKDLQGHPQRQCRRGREVLVAN